MPTPLDIITRALKDIGAIASGEQATPDEAQDAFDMLNDMLDQWSNESMMTYYKTEIVFPVVSNQTQYTIGPTGSINANFTGSITGNILTVTQLTSGAINLNQTLKGTGILPGTTIVQFLTGAGGQVNELGTYLLNVTYPTPIASETMTAYYQRPLAIENGFVRVNTNSNGIPIQNGGLDYPLSVLSYDQYQMIGLKTLPGPWPKAIYYQPTETLGNIFVWPNPSQGELHLYATNLFTRYNTLYDSINLPQGFTNALRWCLAERLMPMFGKANPQQIAMIQGYAAQSKSELKRTNMRPPSVARYDEVITSSRSRDAGWILSGGFFR